MHELLVLHNFWSAPKTNQQEDEGCITTDEESICTFDKKDVKDNGDQ